MTGNVREWCFTSFMDGATHNKIRRGLGYSSTNYPYLGIGTEDGNVPSNTELFTGLRVVRSNP